MWHAQQTLIHACHGKTLKQLAYVHAEPEGAHQVTADRPLPGQRQVQAGAPGFLPRRHQRGPVCRVPEDRDQPDSSGLPRPGRELQPSAHLHRGAKAPSHAHLP